MFRIVSIISLVLFSFGSLAAQWGFSDYAKYDFNSFAKSKVANSRIDFNKVDYKLLHAAVVFETNRQRKKHGLHVFKHSPALEKAALMHSDDMVKLNFFSHTSRVAARRTMGMRLKLVGISNAFSAENIAYSFGIEYIAGKGVYNLPGGKVGYSPQGPPLPAHTYLGCAKGVVKQWMNSPGHRRNILNKKYNYLGVGGAHYKKGRFDYFKFTQNFSSIKGPY